MVASDEIIEEVVVPRGRSVFAKTFRVDSSLKSVLDLDAVSEHLQEQGISRASAQVAHELVNLQNGLSVQEHRALFIATLVTLEARSSGSTYIPLEKGATSYMAQRFRALIPEELHLEDAWNPGLLLEALFRVVASGKASQILGQDENWKPLILQGDRLYHQRILLAEDRLVEAVSQCLRRPRANWYEDEVRDALRELREQPARVGDEEMRLNVEQEYAALTALYTPFSLVTGGPGTGKTSIVVAILRLMARLGMDPASIALAAPTGKAANRMAESVWSQMESIRDPSSADQKISEGLGAPKTLHRLLRYSPTRDEFWHGRENPLPHRVIIVDEASMIDLFLMEHLIDAVSPRAQLVLLGDAEQLPSVDTGAVLRDLLPSALDTDTPWRDLVDGNLEDSMSDELTAASSMRLEKSYRMDRGTEEGQQIFALASNIRKGRFVSADEVAERRRPKDLQWQGVEWLNPGRLASGKVDLYDFLSVYFEAHIADAISISPFVEFDDEGLTEKSSAQVRRLHDHFKKTRILTLTRVFETGSEILNEALHRQFLRRRGKGQDYALAPGEPVMMLRNDYEKNLFNGDQGVVVMHDKKPQVAFPRGEDFAVFPLAGLVQHLEISFAMTVHKAQGSEFQRVAMVLPGHDMSLLTRELLYTGITRAREGAALIGSLSRFNEGVGRPVQRFTAVREKLL